MRIKIKIVISIIVVVILFALVIIYNNIKISKENGIIISEIKDKYSKNWESSICDFLYERIDFNSFPLSKNFKMKYKSINDIFKGNVTHIFENDYFDNYDKNMNNILTITCETGKGYEQVAYQLHYVINENNELDDIEILDSRIYEDENGEYPQYVKHHYYYDEPDIVTAMLCYPYVTINKDKDYYRVYVTDNFLKKFPDYLTIGVTGDTDYIMYGNYYRDKENKNVCYAEFLGLEWTKTYKLTYEIDDKGYINDIDIELYEKNKTEDPEYVKSYYQEYLDNVDN